MGFNKRKMDDARGQEAEKEAVSRQARYDRTKHWRRDRSSSAWGKRMAALRALKLSGPQRSEIARNAALARHRRRPAPADSTPE
jgi:hypothetical protein